MKVTLNWLKEYVDFNWTVEELAERLTMLGVEVEGIVKQGGEFEGVVVAQVLTAEKHPNADKLSVCSVMDGKGPRQIVCGAKNFKPGDKVPLALPGCVMPTAPGEPPFVIKVGKIRNVESHGMMCSGKELGLADDADGLLLLPADAVVGQPFAQHLGRAGSDAILDLEITPNRPDLNSVIGIAREIAALTGNPLRLPAIKQVESQAQATTEMVDVRIENSTLCPRYVARIIHGVKVGPSPEWLKQKLVKVGLRSINNVVDVTNFVMVEVGQPLHAFDYRLLQTTGMEKPAVVVRTATPQEKITTLDGKERALDESMLLIANSEKAVAIAGVMGGQNSEVGDSTSNLLLESACFNPQSIRATSKKLDLRTDASYRYERGADVGICEWASERAASLIVELAGGKILQTPIDAYPGKTEVKEVSLRFQKVTELLGVEIPKEQMVAFLTRLECVPSLVTDSMISVRVPSFRVDIKSEIDLVEEVVRLFGIENVPSTAPRGAIGSNVFDTIFDQHNEVRNILVSLGITEAQGQTLISSQDWPGDPEKVVSLKNPLSSDMNILRPSLLPGLITSLRNNLTRKTASVALFEIGKVFNKSNQQSTENRNVAIAMTGPRSQIFWQGADRDANFDIYDVKGLLEEFFEHFGIRGVTLTRREGPTGLYVESASIVLGKFEIGTIGQLTPVIARKNDLRDAVMMLELNLDLLVARRNAARSFKALPQFPSIRRDVAMVVPESITHEMVSQAVKQSKAPNLELVELFDVFRGKNVPEGQKSVAYAFIYRAMEKTLTDTEVNAAHELVLGKLKGQLNATIRDN